MGRRRKPHPFIENLSIERIGSEGKSIGFYEGKVVLVPSGIPGDVADVQVVKKKKSYLEGKIKKLVTPSPLRQPAFCKHFGTCGGCKWQSLPYSEQVNFKTQQVVDQLTRIGHLELPEVQPILQSEHIRHYRNKLEFTFSNYRWLDDPDQITEEKDMRGLGFHVPGRFDKVLQIETCYLQDDYANTIRNGFDKQAREQGWTYYDIRNQVGFLRNLIVRNNSKNEWMLVLVVGERNQEWIDAAFTWIKQALNIHSTYLVVNEKKNDSIADLEPELIDGEAFLEEDMDGLIFRIGPKSFFQTNTEQAKVMYRKVLECASLKPEDNVYDLYTGTGTIANYMARHCASVTGIEYIEEAVIAARQSAELNNIDNTTFYAGDMAKVLTTAFFQENGAPDVIVTDPPRAGMHPDVVQRLIESNARRIVYVSCNPATQARDLAMMDEHYTVTHVQPIDMFPHTHHVENIVVLERREHAE